MAAREDVMHATASHSQRALTGRCLLTRGHLHMRRGFLRSCAQKPNRSDIHL